MNAEKKQLKNTNIEKKDIEKEKKNILNNSSTLKNQDKNELNELKKILSMTQKNIHDLKIRHLAHIENIKKNTEVKNKHIKNIKKEQFFTKIIPIIEILENTLLFSKKNNLDQDALIQGIELILKSLLAMIYKFGVKIEGKQNEIFNPNIHDVILTENSKKIKSNHVISVKKIGFSFNNHILRKALVTISKN